MRFQNPVLNHFQIREWVGAGTALTCARVSNAVGGCDTAGAVVAAKSRMGEIPDLILRRA